MRYLIAPRLWFAIAAALTVLVLFAVDGTAGGLVAVAAFGSFLFAAIRSVMGDDVDDRAAWVGWFGHYF